MDKATHSFLSRAGKVGKSLNVMVDNGIELLELSYDVKPRVITELRAGQEAEGTDHFVTIYPTLSAKRRMIGFTYNPKIFIKPEDACGAPGGVLNNRSSITSNGYSAIFTLNLPDGSFCYRVYTDKEDAKRAVHHVPEDRIFSFKYNAGKGMFLPDFQ